MNKNKELKTLNSTVHAIENPDAHKAKLQKKSLMLTIVAALGLLISFILYFQGLKGLYLPALASFSGALYGLSIYLDSTIQQWPILAKHVDINSVKQRIAELETYSGSKRT